MPDDYDYFKNKRADRVYLSRTLEQKAMVRTDSGEVREMVRPFRIVSKIVESSEDHKFIKEGKEVSLRITDEQRQEIKAKFYEDTRGVFTLQIQRYTIETGAPHNLYFTFVGDEILTLYNFLRDIAILPLKSRDGVRLDDRFIDELILSKEQAMKLLQDQPDLVEELLKNEITKEDLANLAYRRSQLEEFNKMLDDRSYFESCIKTLGRNKGPEGVWQDFFERNPWIFGYGLSYFFNMPLEGSKLEQVVSGADFSKRGKRVDALLKTQGVISALAFGEIKTHTTPLLTQSSIPYRGESWAISKEVSGGIAQVQRTVQRSIENLLTKLSSKINRVIFLVTSSSSTTPDPSSS